MEQVRRSLERHRDQLLRLPNVVGVGVGYKETGGQVTGQLSIAVLVERKLPMAQLAPRHVVPRAVDDVVTDVIETGKIRALGAGTPGDSNAGTLRNEVDGDPAGAGGRRWNPVSRLRPAMPGCSIAHYRVTAGTFGAVVRERRGGSRGGSGSGSDSGSDSDSGSGIGSSGSGLALILSNNHVLANSTTGRDRRARRGDPVLQPGPHDGGKAEKDVIATLWRYIPISKRKINLVDAALARPVAPGLIRPEILGLGKVVGTREAVLGMEVRKSGRTTGLTSGVVRVLQATVKVEYGFARPVSFAGQIVTTAMSAGGDSGSLVLDRQNRAVGLLFAGSDLTTIMAPINTVLELLEVELWED